MEHLLGRRQVLETLGELLLVPADTKEIEVSYFFCSVDAIFHTITLENNFAVLSASVCNVSPPVCVSQFSRQPTSGH